MIRDFIANFSALDQRASATVEVIDFSAGVLTAATGTITYGVPVDGDTVIVNGDTFTKVAETPGAGEFTNITELEALVEAVTGVNSSQDGTDIAITAATAGSAGNEITLALGESNTGTMSISGATLTGGIDAFVLTVNGTALTEGTDFTAETDNDTTATNIAAAIDGESGFTASADGAVITMYWETPGTAGNAKTLVTSDETNLPISGDTFSGGVAATYTDSFFTDDGEEVEEQLIVTTLSGTPTLDVTPQYTLDGDNWSDDASAFTQATGATSQTLSETLTGVKRRYKLVLGGTNPLFTGKINAVVK